MEALGYSRNRHPFFELAYSLTYSDLLKTVRAVPLSERSKRLEEALLREAGLPGGPGADKGRRYSWTLSGVRPSNHPAKRIAGFSLVLERLMSMQDGRTEYDGRSLTRTVLGLADSHDNADAAIRALEKALMGLSADGDVAPAGPTTPVPIGKGRARDMMVNAVLPFLFALGRADKDETLTSRSLALYKHSPKLQENELTREAWSALFEGLKCVDDPGGQGPPSNSQWSQKAARAAAPEKAGDLPELTVLKASGDVSSTPTLSHALSLRERPFPGRR